MPTAKDEARRVLESLPDDASYEDIHYAIYVRQRISRALESVRTGRVMSHEEVERRMARWLARRGNGGFGG